MSPFVSPQLNLLPLVTAPVVRQFRYWLKRQTSVTNMAVTLGLAGGLIAIQTIAPSAVHAYTGTVNVTIDVQPSETYDTLVRRAEAIARAATQRSFDRDILMTDVAIVVIAQSATSTVPVLSLTTTRSQWRGQPDARRWATYYSTAKALLGMNTAPSGAGTTAQPTITTSAPAATSTAPQPRSTPANTSTAPAAARGGATTGATTGRTQTPTPTRSPILPQRIPTPANIGK
ncbi:hypothetical protein H6F76_06485 [Leptolyngbya sp. FACHB-321]|uniref:hypothetical protein n=1 Tax=Leptolyngbya sp. FACHB-321 TaxID=2692807 RepID=UPI0016880AB1|nr:hypothetical protein [Leptolyngbya sp. FACHB-321]MBD2034680.1 hypothetical protein [Leptolyngbya sp. FACHB-321]